jgi:hypothetical protein
VGDFRIFKMKGLAKFARREQIADSRLREVIERDERGVIDADLGGGLIRQRVARRGQGRSGGYRMMIAYRTEDRAFFLLGFPKNERENVSPDELAALRKLAEVWLHTSDARIADSIHEGILHEVFDEDEGV